MKKTYIIR